MQPVFQTFPIDNSTPDAVQILKYLISFRDTYQASPVVREAALSIIGRIGPQNVQRKVAGIFQFVRQKMVYTGDSLGVELVMTPDRLLNDIAKQGYAYGDCDDFVLLFNSLLGSLGIHTDFVAVKLHSQTVWDHVISKVYYDFQWNDYDPCSRDVFRKTWREVLTVSNYYQ